MSIRGILLAISACGVVVAVGAFLFWATMMSSSDDDWEARSAKIDLLWKIIPWSLVVSILAAIASTLLKGRSVSRSFVGLALAASAAVIGGAILWVVLHLGIA